MMRYLRIAAVALLIATAALYAGDWLIFKLRGSPVNTVTVSLFVSAPLKGEKQEIDFIGQEQWNCTRTLFPFPPYQKNQSMPCWYLLKHTNQTTTY
jgi:hypothetical protein